MTRIIALSSILAAFVVAAPVANAQSTTANSGKFCLEASGSQTAKNCSFASMEACQKEIKGTAGKCVPNPTATTGSGGMNKDMKK
jgi:hypothetical protein